MDLKNEKIYCFQNLTAQYLHSVRTASLDLLFLLGVQKNEAWNDAAGKAKTVVAKKQADLNYRKDALRLTSI